MPHAPSDPADPADQRRRPATFSLDAQTRLYLRALARVGGSTMSDVVELAVGRLVEGLDDGKRAEVEEMLAAWARAEQK